MSGTYKDTDYIIKGDVIGAVGPFATREDARTHALSLLREWSNNDRDLGVMAYRTEEQPDVTVCVITSCGEEWDSPRLFVRSVAAIREETRNDLLRRKQAREVARR